MDRCRVIVTFEMKEEAIPGLKERLEKSTPKTLAEKGCLAAGMYQAVSALERFAARRFGG